MLHQVDQNSDGRINKSELLAYYKKNMAKLRFVPQRPHPAVCASPRLLSAAHLTIVGPVLSLLFRVLASLPSV